MVVPFIADTVCFKRRCGQFFNKSEENDVSQYSAEVDTSAEVLKHSASP